MDTLRISDNEREAAVAQLGEHYAVGRLSKQEYDERAETAWSAKTKADLAPLFLDLPSPQAQRPVAQRSRPVTGRRRRFHGAHSWGPLPMVPIWFVLIALSVITYLPFWILGFVAMFAVGSRNWGARGCHPSSRRSVR